MEELGGKLASQMDPSGRDDISILAMQRLFNHQPNGPTTPVDMALDYFRYDYEFAEPPRATSLQNTEPLPTAADFGEDNHFVADQRGFEAIIYHIARQYLSSDRKSGNIVDPRLKLNKVYLYLRLLHYVKICVIKQQLINNLTKNQPHRSRDLVNILNQ